jgi:deoxycytidylate deaminase
MHYSSANAWKDTTTPKASTERQEYFLNVAAKVAHKSVMTHQHGAVIVLDNTIISTGYNYAYDHMCHTNSIHAEVDALIKVKGVRKNSLTDAEMYVVRIGPNTMSNQLKYSKPCCSCQKAIAKYGIRKVYYSTSVEYNSFVKCINDTSDNHSVSSTGSSASSTVGSTSASS